MPGEKQSMQSGLFSHRSYGTSNMIPSNLHIDVSMDSISRRTQDHHVLKGVSLPILLIHTPQIHQDQKHTPRNTAHWSQCGDYHYPRRPNPNATPSPRSGASKPNTEHKVQQHHTTIFSEMRHVISYASSSH